MLTAVGLDAAAVDVHKREAAAYFPAYAPLALEERSTLVGGLVSLKILNLAKNQLTSLPEGVGGLVSLEGLHLGGNQLTSLPEGITALTGLQLLLLDDNPLVRPQTPTVEAWLAALAASGCDIRR